MHNLIISAKHLRAFCSLGSNRIRAFCLLNIANKPHSSMPRSVDRRCAEASETCRQIRSRSILGGLDPSKKCPFEATSPLILKAFAQAIGSKTQECLLQVNLDKHGWYLSDQEIFFGVTRSIDGRFRRIADCALSAGAAAVVFVHNHPSGHVFPSEADIRTTNDLRTFLHAIDVELQDHIVVTKGEAFSMRIAGYI